MHVVYFSGLTGYTARFVARLGLPSTRIPLERGQMVDVREPYILVVPSYAKGRQIVPPQVVRFLNDERNRAGLRGVVATGNINFNKDYAISGRAVAYKCQVPLLHTLELFGTEPDVTRVQQIVAELEVADSSAPAKLVEVAS